MAPSRPSAPSSGGRRRWPTGRCSGTGKCDLLIFARTTGKDNVTTLVERRSRYVVLPANPDRRSARVMGRIEAALGGLPTLHDRGNPGRAVPTSLHRSAAHRRGVGRRLQPAEEHLGPVRHHARGHDPSGGSVPPAVPDGDRVRVPWGSLHRFQRVRRRAHPAVRRSRVCLRQAAPGACPVAHRLHPGTDAGGESASRPAPIRRRSDGVRSAAAQRRLARRCHPGPGRDAGPVRAAKQGRGGAGANRRGRRAAAGQWSWRRQSATKPRSQTCAGSLWLRGCQ